MSECPIIMSGSSWWMRAHSSANSAPSVGAAMQLYGAIDGQSRGGTCKDGGVAGTATAAPASLEDGAADIAGRTCHRPQQSKRCHTQGIPHITVRGARGMARLRDNGSAGANHLRARGSRRVP